MFLNSGIGVFLLGSVMLEFGTSAWRYYIFFTTDS